MEGPGAHLHPFKCLHPRFTRLPNRMPGATGSVSCSPSQTHRAVGLALPPSPQMLHEVFTAVVNMAPLTCDQRKAAELHYGEVRAQLCEQYASGFASVLDHSEDITRTLLGFMDVDRNGILTPPSQGKVLTPPPQWATTELRRVGGKVIPMVPMTQPKHVRTHRGSE